MMTTTGWTTGGASGRAGIGARVQEHTATATATTISVPDTMPRPAHRGDSLGGDGRGCDRPVGAESKADLALRTSALTPRRAARGILLVSGPLTRLAGVATAIAGLLVLAGWALGSTQAASLVAGWRVMVPSTAFGFLCVGVGLVLASARGAEHRGGRLAVRVLAGLSLILPVLTLFEYAFEVRLRRRVLAGLRVRGPPTVMPAECRRSRPCASSCWAQGLAR